MKTLAGWIDEALRARSDAAVLGRIRAKVAELCAAHPLYPSRAA
jgi:glycine/serine hydroxymethyltransferase